jgi:protein-S-isoprenylcysteine O-methyltransferase Ste14
MTSLENRIPPPVLGLALGLSMWLVARRAPGADVIGPWRWMLGGLLLAGGIAFAALGVRAFRRAQTTIDPVHPERASALVVTGIYRFTRNPMYVGFALLLGAWALVLGSAWTLLGVLVFVAWIDRLQIPPEEHALRAKFGAEFEHYAQRVRRWL